ncbi:MAG: flagellar type III secretion system protein FlhB [Betaproteobacteria bacterium]|nr:flagellar type III secretion system protein FlhB [Betaproteobacteria bacterium]
MAEDTGLERTEPASVRRREQAREEGQVARSRELSTLALLLAAGAGLWFMGAGLADRLSGLMRHGMQLERALAFDTDLMLLRLKDSSVDALLAFSPLLALLVLAGIASALLLNGWLFSFKPLAPDWERIDPLKGLARILSWHGVIEMLKAIAKTVLVGGVAAWVMWHNIGAVLSLAAEPLGAGMAHLVHLLGASFLVMAGSMALVAAIDVPFQIWEHERKLRMTREEVRQENKETEGDPQVKAHIRSQQREMARRRMMAEIPKADVVVTNPTHYAVALRYQDGSMRAPRMVAKGAHLLAARIRALAVEHQVPILQAPPLARALYRHAELGDEIPAALYTAVAEVLAYVYQLRRHRQDGGPMPQQPDLAPLPPGLDPGLDPGASAA